MCNNITELDRSLEAVITNTVFFEDVNDIIVYVEDTNKEAEYETIFKRLFKDKYRISKIFAAGGKINVIDAYHKEKDKQNKKLLFIVDGDFDRFKGDRLIQDERFIYLEMYNIESYFIDEYATSQFVKSLICKIDNEVSKLLNFHQWYREIIDQSKELFFLYLYIQVYRPGFENVSRSSFEFLDFSTGLPKKDNSFSLYKEEILKNDNQAEERISELKNKYNLIYGEDYRFLICGKFLIDGLSSRIKSVVSGKSKNFDKKQLRWCLINFFDIEKLAYIRDRVQRLYH